jgi:hypothetical protein
MESAVRRAALLTMLIALGTALVVGFLSYGGNATISPVLVLITGPFLVLVFFLLIMAYRESSPPRGRGRG